MRSMSLFYFCEEATILHSSPLIGQGERTSGCDRGGLDWILGKISSLKEF